MEGMMEAQETPKKAVKKKSTKKFIPVFKHEERKVSHKFECSVEMRKKNVGVTGSEIWQPEPHTHVFRTVNSDLKDQFKCVAIGGHTHEVTVEEVDGELVATCGPARREKRGKLGAPLVHDDHTHTFTYKRSEEVIPRIKSDKAALAINDLLSKTPRDM